MRAPRRRTPRTPAAPAAERRTGPAAPDGEPDPSALATGFTVADVAQRYRVGEDKVRGWINRGELRAVNTAATLCGKPRWVIPPEALAEFERRRAGGPAPKAPRRRRPAAGFVDYFPD